jgi:uncharacterized membrane protein YfcA
MFTTIDTFYINLTTFTAMNLDILYLIVIGFVAGIINTLAGGGSVLTLPMLIFMGLPPALANGTNRVGVFLQTLVGVAGYQSKGVKATPHGLYWGISATLGSILGAWWAIDIKGDTFNTILGFVLIMVVVLTVVKPKNLSGLTERLTGKYFWLSMIAFFFIGIYGGFIQAGVGFFILLTLTRLNHLNLIKSNAIKLLVVAIYTLAALVVFIWHGEVNWFYGLILAVGQSIGAWFTSRWSVKKDDKWIRIFLVVVAVAMAVKLWFF